MKKMLVTLPLREGATTFPPMGCLALIAYLRKHGIDDIEFYDIDFHRPQFEDAVERIVEFRPDVLGISAVVSTAYAYTKQLSLAVKEALPETLIVLGGNMGASAEILLRKTGVDLVATGEGEKTFLNVCRLAETTRDPIDFGAVRGLMFVGKDGNLVNTGYEHALPAEQLYDIDWDDLEKSSGWEYFFPVINEHPEWAEQFKHDPRFLEPHRRGKRRFFLNTTKGCVSKCTFCHRWDRGQRTIPVDIVIERMKEAMERYNCGFWKPADENFGADPRWLEEFCEKLKDLDILWWVNTRAKGMTAEKVQMMKDAGCILLVYGTETGSERILEVMEKKVSLEQNYEALRLSAEAGMGGTIALVIGMPGETPETIQESIDFCKKVMILTPERNPNSMSINYAQALPGTPLYEYGRHKGLIGMDLDGEEQYLLDISDREAQDEFATLNFTDYPTLSCQTWRPLITIGINYHYTKTFGIDHYRHILLNDERFIGTPSESTGYHANPERLLETGGLYEEDSIAEAPASSGNPAEDQIGGKSGGLFSKGREKGPTPPSLFSLVKSGKLGLALICYPVLAYRCRRLLVLLMVYKNVRKYGWSYSLPLIREYLGFKFKRLSRAHRPQFTYKSLRKIVNELQFAQGESLEMEPLRKGR